MYSGDSYPVIESAQAHLLGIYEKLKSNSKKNSQQLLTSREDLLSPNFEGLNKVSSAKPAPRKSLAPDYALGSAEKIPLSIVTQGVNKETLIFMDNGQASCPTAYDDTQSEAYDHSYEVQPL